MIVYGIPADATDEYVRVGESTGLQCLRKFIVAVVEVFGPEYLRLPNEQDIAKLLAVIESIGFFVCLVPLTSCIRAEIIILLLGTECTYVIKRSLQLYWKQLLPVTYVFGMHSLGCLARTMTSMFYNDH
jgi:hypothetical protein